jgi:ribose 5-phosphate isomerase B
MLLRSGVMDIVIGADHRGFAYKEFIKKNYITFKNNPITWHDVGTHSAERTDYVEYAQRACALMRTRSIARAVLICGSGVGMVIVANRYKGIYAGVLWNAQVAAMATHDDHINVLVIAADFTQQEDLIPLIETWLHTPFSAGRYQERITKIDALGGL